MPIIVHGPGIPETMRGGRPGELALNIDVAPTILEMAGVPIPSEMDGMSLYPHITGQQAPSRADFFMEHVGVIDVENPIPLDETIDAFNATIRAVAGERGWHVIDVSKMLDDLAYRRHHRADRPRV